MTHRARTGWGPRPGPRGQGDGQRGRPGAPEIRIVRLVTIPSVDATFAAAAQRALTPLGSVAQFAARLRQRYPAAIVEPRTISDEPERVWYVYRDGWALGAGRQAAVGGRPPPG